MFGPFRVWQGSHFPCFPQGGQRPLQEKGSPVSSPQRSFSRAARGGPLPAQPLWLQRQQQRILTGQSQEPPFPLTARQEYVEILDSPPPPMQYAVLLLASQY